MKRYDKVIRDDTGYVDWGMVVQDRKGNRRNVAEGLRRSWPGRTVTTIGGWWKVEEYITEHRSSTTVT